MAGISRRSFLSTGIAGGAACFGLDALVAAGLPRVAADEATVAPSAVRFRPEIEPLVRLLEETPREKLIEEVGARIRKGTSYREVLAALFLAGIRNVEPRPNVGFKFHSVLVVHSAHTASLASPDADRWLPIFWALDYFKSAQAQDDRERNWTMPPVDESRLPDATRARAAFVDAMEAWDEEKADVAAAALARTAGLAGTFAPLWRFGMRDFRSIGHKAIYVAGAWRVLQAIGHEHAEPIVRSLAYALLMHGGENPAKSDQAADRAWRKHLEIVKEIPESWRGGKADSGATRELLETLREASDLEAGASVVELLRRGVGPQSVWDAFFAMANELVLRQPAIVPLHAVTTVNALRFAWDTAADDETRRLILLQSAAFLASFRDAAEGRGTLPAKKIDEIEPRALETTEGDALEAIFAEAGKDRDRAVAQALAWLDGGGDPRALIAAARRLVFLKGRDAHDYKFSSAALEDYDHVGPEWRDRCLASSLALLRHAGERDNGLVTRTRAALG